MKPTTGRRLHVRQWPAVSCAESLATAFSFHVKHSEGEARKWAIAPNLLADWARQSSQKRPQQAEYSCEATSRAIG